MTLQEIICLFKGHVSPWIVLLVIMSLLVEITPIKLNPWSWILGKLGKAFNGPVMKEIDGIKIEIGSVKKEVTDIKKDVGDIRDEAKEREATNRRTRILEFGDEILHEVDYSKEHWDQILLDITEYENYCDEHIHYMNNVAKATIRHIKDMYDKHLREDSFLK